MFVFCINYSFGFDLIKLNGTDVVYDFDKENYKVQLKSSTEAFSYKETSNFRIYLPKFLIDYRVELLRGNSKGEINGILSKNKETNFQNIVIHPISDLDYYLTDMKIGKNQLRHLDSGEKIYYDKKTSLVFEGYGLNLSDNRSYYFSFDKNKDAKELKNLIYSYHLILNKKLVDEYVRKNLKIEDYEKKEFELIHTYLMNLTNPKRVEESVASNSKIQDLQKDKKIKENKVVTPLKVTQKTEDKIENKKEPIRLNPRKVLFMKEFNYTRIKLNMPVNDQEKQNSSDKQNGEEIVQSKEKLEKFLALIKDINKQENPKSYEDNSYKQLKLIAQLKDLKNEVKDLNRVIEKIDFRASRYDYTFGFDLYTKMYEDLLYYKGKIDNLFLEIDRDGIKLDRAQESIKEIDNSAAIKNIEELLKNIKVPESKKVDEIAKEDRSFVCYSKIEQLDESCMNIEGYYDSFIQYSLGNTTVPSKELLLKYSNAKILNNIAVFYYKAMDFENAQFYLDKALSLAKDPKEKELILFNKGILLNHSDSSEAVKFYKQTTLKEAYYNLGIAYYNGYGVQENDREAFFYFKKAKDLGFVLAKENYDKMIKLGFNFK